MTLTAPMGFTSVKGFKAHGVHCGLKKQRLDLAVILSTEPDTQAAAVFTQNAFAAAPVHVSRQHVADGNIQAIVVNSGNANACTGRQGLRDAVEMTARTAANLGLKEDQVFVCSTGRIGVPLPMEKIRAGIDACTNELPDSLGTEVTQAIMTTDTGPKEAQASIVVDGIEYNIAGIAKGAGMIHPNMATMLGFIATDAPVHAAHLRRALNHVVDRSFNQISVDGDESTNDTVCLVANGAAGGPALTPEGPGWDAFLEALLQVAQTLAKRIAADGEGATKLMSVNVIGAATATEARKAARAVAKSNLVKSAIHGEDPNWGRIVSSIGSTDARVDPSVVDLFIGNTDKTIAVLVDGEPRDGVELDARNLMADSEVLIRIDLHQGEGEAWAWGCDLTTEYVTFNSAYTT